MAESERIAVERALTSHYLGTESGNGAGPVRTINASRSSLAEALGPACGTDPVAMLARACDGPLATAHVLSDGWNAEWPDAGSPGFFRYLVLTCAVVALADDADSRDFGVNLAALWQCDNIFGNRAVSVRRTRLESDGGCGKDGVHQGNRWTPWNKPRAGRAAATTAS